MTDRAPSFRIDEEMSRLDEWMNTWVCGLCGKRNRVYRLCPCRPLRFVELEDGTRLITQEKT